MSSIFYISTGHLKSATVLLNFPINFQFFGTIPRMGRQFFTKLLQWDDCNFTFTYPILRWSSTDILSTKWAWGKWHPCRRICSCSWSCCFYLFIYLFIRIAINSSLFQWLQINVCIITINFSNVLACDLNLQCIKLN